MDEIFLNIEKWNHKMDKKIKRLEKKLSSGFERVPMLVLQDQLRNLKINPYSVFQLLNTYIEEHNNHIFDEDEYNALASCVQELKELENRLAWLQEIPFFLMNEGHAEQVNTILYETEENIKKNLKWIDDLKHHDVSNEFRKSQEKMYTKEEYSLVENYENYGNYGAILKCCLTTPHWSYDNYKYLTSILYAYKQKSVTKTLQKN